MRKGPFLEGQWTSLLGVQEELEKHAAQRHARVSAQEWEPPPPV